MEDKKLDWSTFTVKTPFEHSEDKIKNAWLTQQDLEKWFLKRAVFKSPSGDPRQENEKIQTGDSYKWQWFGWPESVEETGKIIEPKNDEFLRFVFGKAGTVSLSITEEHGQRILKLTQEDIPLDEESRMNFYVGCKTGWTFYILNLKSILQGGPDLRNKKSELQMD